jgi:transcriptional regulator NrdR family protein
MNDQETIGKFIALRAQGWTFDRIAETIKVSKPTLIGWSRQHAFQIQNLQAVELEAIAEKHLASRQSRWEQLGGSLRRVQDELAQRNLADVPTARLITLASALRAEAGRETAALRFTSALRDIPDQEQIEKVMEWPG